MAKSQKKQAAAKKLAKKQAKVLKMEQPVAQPAAPVVNQIMRPPMRNLVIETDGDTLFMRSCTMGMIELRQALKDTMGWAEAESNKRAATPAGQPAPEAVTDDAQPAEEASPPQEQDDG